MAITVATTIDELYRKIVAIEDPLLCWAFASPHCNDTGFCLPSDLCAKIRMQLPPYSYRKLPRHPKGGYKIDDNTVIYASIGTAMVTHCVGDVKKVAKFSATGDVHRQIALHSYCEGGKYNETITPGVHRDLFVYEVRNMTIFLSAPKSSKSRIIRVGNLECSIPISKLDISVPIVSITASMLSTSISRGPSQLQLTLNSNESVWVSAVKADIHVGIRIKRDRDGKLTTPTSRMEFEKSIGHDATHLIFELVSHMI